MKKNIKLIILLLIIILLILIVLINRKNKDNDLNKKNQLDEIKNEIKQTKKIYVCNQSNNLKQICSKSDILKIINDENIIQDFLLIVDKLDEENGAQTQMGDPYTLYLLDSSDNIIVSIDFYQHFKIKKLNYTYSMSTRSNDKLKEILKIEN